MGLNIGRALQIAGQGLDDYSEFLYRKQAYDEERKEKQEQRDWERTFRMAEAAADRENERQGRIRSDRDFFGRREDAELGRLNRMGVLPGTDFGRDYQASMLPDVQPGISDTGGMVLQGLKQQGQRGVSDFYGALPGAMNRLVAGRGVSEPLPGGGMVTLQPSVRASLINAELDHEAAMARATAMRRATAGQAREAENEEAQGLALLNSPASGPLSHAFGLAYQGARAGNPTMPPGQLAMQVYHGLKGTRPDLFPRPPSTAQGGYVTLRDGTRFYYGDALDDADGQVPTDSSSGASSSRGSTDPIASMPQDEALAQRWDELTAAGIPPEEATQQVLQEAQRGFDGVNLPAEGTPKRGWPGAVARRGEVSVAPGDSPPHGSMPETAGRAIRSPVTPPPGGWFGGRSLGEVVSTPLGELFPGWYSQGTDAADIESAPRSPVAAQQRTLAERRAEWDRLAVEFGAGRTSREVGPRP